MDKEELLWSYRDEIRRYLSVFRIPYDQLDDAVQDTFIAAWQNIHKLRDESKIKNWLFAIAKNVGRKYAARSAETQAYFVSLDEQTDICYDSGENKKELNNEISNEELFSYMQEFTNEELLYALNKLKPKEKSILLLHYIYGHNFRQISKIVGENYSNTRSIVFRAKAKLRDILKNEDI